MDRTIPLMLRDRKERMPDLAAQWSKGASGAFAPVSLAALYAQALQCAAGLRALGVSRGDRVGLVSDNRSEWLVADLAILSLGAADVPRGCDTTDREIRYILSFSGCKAAVVENARQLAKIASGAAELRALRTVVMLDEPGMDDQASAASAGWKLLSFAELMALGAASDPASIEAEIDKGDAEDVATIIFTSGTTGEPKGVMLCHRNFLYQCEYLPLQIHPKPGEVWLSVLPVWHVFERILQYVAISTFTSLAYSKPIGSVMLADFQAVRPHWMGSVPRIWESVQEGVYRTIRQQGGLKLGLFNFFVAAGKAHARCRQLLRGWLPRFGRRPRALDAALGFLPWLLLAPVKALGNLLVFRKIKAKLGGRFIAGISGGGALPPQVDSFFAAVGVLLLEGYGLTETAPVVAARCQHKPVPGTVGLVLKGTRVRILDDAGAELPPGRRGVISVNGPQVMKGYYNKADLTAKVLDKEGWLDTGDLGMLTRDNELKITGRAKDTIVLRGGENVEPAPIEMKIAESPYVQQAVVLGQDQKWLAALVVPRQDAVMAYATGNNVPVLDYETLLAQPEIYELIDDEVMELVHPRNGFRSFERIYRIALLPKPFEVGVELSHKQEVMRHKVNELYARTIAGLFKERE